MADAEKDLFDRLTTPHGDYTRYRRDWNRQRQAVTQQITPEELREILPQGGTEDANAYAERIRISEWEPETAGHVERLIGALYENPPDRKYPTALEPFLANTNGRGQDWQTAVEQACRRLLTYGTTRDVVTPTTTAERAADGEAEDFVDLTDASRLRWVPYTALDTIDWALAPSGSLEWVRTHEVVHGRLPDGTPEPVRHIVTLWHAERVEWWTFEESEEQEGKFTLVEHEDRPHAIGEPWCVAEVWPVEVRPYIGTAWTTRMTRLDIQRFRGESDWAHDVHLHAHPVLKYKGMDDLHTIGVGSSSAIKIGEDEDIGYLEYPSSASTALAEWVKRKEEAIVRSAQADPMGRLSQHSPYQASGLARSWSYSTTEARILSSLATVMSRLESRVLRLAARHIDLPESEIGRISVVYPEDFSADAAEAVRTSIGFAKDEVPSDTYVRYLMRRLIASDAGDASIEERRKMIEEIESGDVRPQPTLSALSPENFGPGNDDPDEDDSDEDEDG